MSRQAQSDPSRRIVALNRDLFFGIRLKQLGAALGYTVELTPDAAAFLSKLAEGGVALGVIDINASPDWELLASGAGSSDRPPVLAFGPHQDVEGMRAAKNAGVTRVVSNGQFHRDPASLILRYANDPRATPPDQEESDLDAE